jgi:TDG/mug DNA glycosylase family protein
MFDLLGEEFSDDYDVKKKLLLDNNIALWDVIENCYREGSLDSNIKNAKPNDFEKLYSEYSDISHVYFNGAKAYNEYKRKVGFDENRTFTRLLSTSPANAVKFSIKKDDWKKILR